VNVLLVARRQIEKGLTESQFIQQLMAVVQKDGDVWPLAWPGFELIRTSHFPSLFACRRISMPIDSNDAEDNEEREGDFYSHAHTWSFLLVQRR
jgi:hypothetical protein